MQLQSVQPWDIWLNDIPSRYSFSAYSLGLVFIFLHCVVWIAAAVMTQYIYHGHEMESPFLLTYVGMALMAPFLAFDVAADRKPAKKQVDAAEGNTMHPIQQTVSVDSLVVEMKSVASADSLAGKTITLGRILTSRTLDLVHNKHKQWDHKKHLLAAIQIAPAMFFADWAFNASLLHTSVSSATVLVSLQSIVVFLLAVLVRIEGFSFVKLCGVLLAVAGTALTALHDASDEDSHAILGDLLAVIAAFTYAIYTVQVRVFCPQNEQLYNMQLLLGYIGLVVLVSLLPFAAYAAYKMPRQTLASWGAVFLKGFLDFCVTDYFMFRSIVLTSATVATVGLGLTIPMAFAADLISHNNVDDIVSIYSIVGALTVAAGFLCVSLTPDMEVDEREEQHAYKLEPEPPPSHQTAAIRI